MNPMKKIVVLLLALVMALALAVPTAASTVSNSTGHAYNAYQIFQGTQSTTSSALGDAAWGTGIKSGDFLAALKADSRFIVSSKNLFADCTTAADVAAVMADQSDGSDVARAFADVAARHLTSTATAIAAGATSVNLNAGYYLLVDTTAPGVGDAMNSALLQVTNKGDITIQKKYEVPSVDKSVMDTDGNWGEAADWCIGSSVPFRLVGTLPGNYDDYETYRYVFHDTLSTGLQYKGDVKVYVRNGSVDTELNTGYTVTPNAAATAGGGSLTITFDNLKTVASVTSDSEIVVKYTAKLLNTAVIGQPGNPNEVYLEYASNPNFSGTGTPPTSHTPEDTVLVFTYQLNVNKVDGADTTKHLSGAEFKLKCVKAETEATWNGKWVTVADNKVTGWVDTQDKGTALTTGTDGLAWVAGLDAGTYELYETKAPVGYNRVKDPITIVIAATLDKGENTPALTALTIKVGSGAAEDGNMAGGTVTTTVQNNAGATLPETGGIGTTLFYIIGGTLMVGAAVFLVIRKRMNNK